MSNASDWESPYQKFNERVISPQLLEEEPEQEFSLRPKILSEFVGQKKIKESLHIYLEAAKQRNEPLDHVLLAGPPGLGKTTLANIIVNDMDAQLIATSGPTLEKPSDLASLLTNLNNNDVLFIDEIHRLRSVVEEYLYPAMEDFKIDIMLESGPSAKSIQLNLKRFTLVGATTRSGMLTSPLRDRFGLSFRMENYSPQELESIITRSASLLQVGIDPEASAMLAGRCRGTPRIANRILRRCRDVAQVKGNGSIDIKVVKKTLGMLGIDSMGLDEMDRNILQTIIQKFGGHPVGLTTLGASVGEEVDTIEEVYEPFLIQQGLLQRTPRGRIATVQAYKHLGFTRPKDSEIGAVQDLFEE